MSASVCAQSCLTLCDLMDYNPPGSSVHGISHAGILEWVVISSSMKSSRPRNWTQVFCTGRLIPLSHLGSPYFLRPAPKSPNQSPHTVIGFCSNTLFLRCPTVPYSFDAKSHKPKVFNYRCVSGGRWLEDIYNIQCFFSSFLASELYLRDLESGSVGEDGTKAESAVRRDKTRHAFTRQIFTGHPHRPHRDLGVKDNRQIKQDPWFLGSFHLGAWEVGKTDFPAGSVVKNPPANAGATGDAGLISGSGRSPGKGNGNPLQYSCQDNLMDSPWRATVHGVEKSRTQLSNWAHIRWERHLNRSLWSIELSAVVEGRMPWGRRGASTLMWWGRYQERLSGEGDPWGPGGQGPSHEKGQDEQVREVKNSMMSGEFYLQLISLEWKVRRSVGEGLGWRPLQTGLGFMLAPKKASWNVHWMFRKSWHDEIMFLNIIWKSATYLILSGLWGFCLFWFVLFSDWVACGILVPQPGIEPAAPKQLT